MGMNTKAGGFATCVGALCGGIASGQIYVGGGTAGCTALVRLEDQFAAAQLVSTPELCGVVVRGMAFARGGDLWMSGNHEPSNAALVARRRTSDGTIEVVELPAITNRASAIAVDHDGIVFVAGPTQGCGSSLFRYEPAAGSIVSMVPPGWCTMTVRALALGPAGDLWAAGDRGGVDAFIARFDAATGNWGVFELHVNRTNEAIAVDDAGLVYFALATADCPGALGRLDPSSGAIDSLTFDGLCALNTPIRGLAMGDDGDIWGSTSQSPTGQIFRLTSSGAVFARVVTELTDRARTIAVARSCRADFDGDATVDFFDYDAFVTCFEGGVCPQGKTADFDGDGAVDFFDYDAFVVAFETPC